LIQICIYLLDLNFRIYVVKKSEIAQNIFNILNDFDDYLKYGFKTKREKKDFSFWDIEENEIKNEIKENSKIVIENKNNQASSNKSKKEMVELGFEILKCERCILGAICKKKIPGVGEIPADIFVISGYLTIENEKNNHPLTQNELELFNKWLDSIKIDRKKIFITSILKCLHYNKKIEREYIEQCRYYLDRQIEIVNPFLIITLGDIALSSLKKEKRENKNFHGESFTYNNRIVFTTYHPKDMLKDYQLRKDIWADLQKIRDFLQKEKPSIFL